ncbi:hypothetical protein SDC9_173365 [bioreactor metagenome]|uniref:Uncharacterized protein n=1 Tax=bioreactor metagenome TaxID=1076179 RepID=A0A645GPR7_9ZZZZ
MRVAKVEIGRLQRGLRGAQIGVGLALRVGALVQFLLRDGALIPQPHGALGLALRVAHAGSCSHHLRLDAIHFGGIRRGVHGEQQIAHLHQRAFAKVHGLHGARHARSHVHAVHGFKATRKFVPQAHVLPHHLGDGHRNRRCGCMSGAFGGRVGVRALQPEDRAASGRNDGRDAQQHPPAALGGHVVLWMAHDQLLMRMLESTSHANHRATVTPCGEKRRQKILAHAGNGWQFE